MFIRSLNTCSERGKGPCSKRSKPGSAKHIREARNLKAGTPMQVLKYGDRIECIPVKPMQAARGIAKPLLPPFPRSRCPISRSCCTPLNVIFVSLQTQEIVSWLSRSDYQAT